MDITYYNFYGTLYSFLELTAGFLVLCLPTLPKFLGSFEKPTFWPNLRNSLHFSDRSKAEPKTSEPRDDGSQASKRPVEPSDSTARIINYDALSDDIELASKSTKESGEGIIEDDYSGTEKLPELQIMRTVHITTTHEAVSALTVPISRY